MVRFGIQEHKVDATREPEERESVIEFKAKEKRESDERIAAQNISFQLEIQKLKAHLKSGPGGPSS